jgi:hypothetical protein
MSKTKKANTNPARMTVTELLKNVHGVPLWVQFWLERYAGGDDEALASHGMDDDPATREIARLVYDVLYTYSRVQFAEIDDKNTHPQFPAEARDFIEEWMYQMTRDDAYVQPWGNPDMAVMALPILLDAGAGRSLSLRKTPCWRCCAAR